MTNTKKKILKTLLALLLINMGCSQKRENKMNTYDISKIYKELKHTESKPDYWLFIHSNNCSFIGEIDNMPVWLDYNEGSMKSLSFPINNYLLKNGVHDISLKILPNVGQNYNLSSSISKGSSIEIKIIRSENKKEQLVLEKKINFNDDQTPYKHVIYEFNVSIPYILEGWSHSMDLTKENQKQLEEEVVNFYKKMMNLYKEKDINKVTELYYKRQLENAQAFYSFKEEDSKKLLADIEKDLYTEQEFKLENYKMVYYGKGKVVGLIRTDSEFLGESAFLGLTEEESHAYSLLLHRPKPGAPLEVIR